MSVGLLLSLLPLHGSELFQFFAVVLPSLGDSPIHPQNQSLGAALARLFAVDNNWSFAVGVGAWKFAGIAVAALLLLIRCVRERNEQGVSLEGVGVAILCALMAGPLTWDHYLAWSVISVMLLAVRVKGWQCCLLLCVLLPMYFPVPYPKLDEIAAHAVWRVWVMVQVITIVIMAAWLVVLPSVPEKQKIE